MAAAVLDQDALQQELKKRKICRFCLCQTIPNLTNIYQRDTRIKTSAPLPIQIMAIASIEVFSNDGMPCFVCSDCTAIFEFSYQFKQMCKKADNLLRQYPLTGKWPQQLPQPILGTPTQQTLSPMGINKQRAQTTQIRIQSANKQIVLQESPAQIRKILNAAPVPDPEPPQPARPKSEIFDDDLATSFLAKLENNDEISIDDIQQLVGSEDADEMDYADPIQKPTTVVETSLKNKPKKLLNKASVRILNKDAGLDQEPRLSLPKIKKDQDGKMEIVAEILNVDEPYENESDPKNAEVIETNVYPCPHCERSFPLLQLRDIHIKNHTRDRKFDCEECDKSFFSKYDLQRHSFTHNGEKPFKCSACDKAFSRSSLLQRHEKSHTDIPKFICVTCERPFISKEAMEKHAERHKINRPFQCKLCNKVFAFKQGLERHEVIHSRQQPYPCQYCNQSFSTTTKLARHLTAHAGQRPYPCKFCKKSYLLSHHLTRHLRSHRNLLDTSTVVSFMCSRCGSNFDTRDQLIAHSTTHATKDNLSCPLCKESFDNIEMLTAHIGSHSEGEAYACEFCDLIFMTPEKLLIHTDAEHAQEMEAYHEDDRVQADLKTQNQEGAINSSNISDETFQTTVDEILLDESSEYAEKPESQIIIKTEKMSPQIINQIVIQSVAENTKGADETEDNNSLLVPLKQRKIQTNTSRTESQPMAQKSTQPSPQLRRKIPLNQPTIEKSLPSIADSLLKMPKGVTVKKTVIKKTAPNNTPMKMQTLNKFLNKLEVSNKSQGNVDRLTSNNSSSVVKMKIGDKNVKVQKMRVTKAQAEAMAKEGKIKIKDGQMILNRSVL
uniref:Protein krueppel n=1 Tax=Stomoxys calcitrans TaxID=35570 RepID=A0A1I8PQ74_STOCA